nr:DNA polymerase epsilon catalytic subunit A-like [Tanacetum cinerariifolium]
ARSAHLCTVMSRMHQRNEGYLFDLLVDFARRLYGTECLEPKLQRSTDIEVETTNVFDDKTDVAEDSDQHVDYDEADREEVVEQTKNQTGDTEAVKDKEAAAYSFQMIGASSMDKPHPGEILLILSLQTIDDIDKHVYYHGWLNSRKRKWKEVRERRKRQRLDNLDTFDKINKVCLNFERQELSLTRSHWQDRFPSKPHHLLTFIREASSKFDHFNWLLWQNVKEEPDTKSSQNVLDSSADNQKPAKLSSEAGTTHEVSSSDIFNSRQVFVVKEEATRSGNVDNKLETSAATELEDLPDTALELGLATGQVKQNVMAKKKVKVVEDICIKTTILLHGVFIILLQI